MNTTEILIDEQKYECRLTAKKCVELERYFGKNPLTIFMSGIPKISDAIKVFQVASGVTEEKAYDLYDAYIVEGNSMPDFIDFVMKIFTDSGFLRKDEESKN